MRIIELAIKHGRYVYRWITVLRKREGCRAKAKRVERIWRQENFKVPKRRSKRGLLSLGDGSRIRQRVQHRNHVWSFDFVADRTQDGRPPRMLTIVDEDMRECPPIGLERRLDSECVLGRLTMNVTERGTPSYIRSDDGPEFTAKAVRERLGHLGAHTRFIEPGNPWENGYNELSNDRLRDELLNGEIFYTLMEKQGC